MKQTIYNHITRFVISFFIVAIFFSFPVLAADDDTYNEKNGIVELYSGISDTNDKFYKVKNCTGFIVSNSDSECYIVTTYSGIKISSKEKTNCLKSHNLSNDNFGYNEAVKVIVNGDVSSSVNIIAKSKKENFVILQAESVINEKETLKLGNSVEKDEKVISLGFVNTSSDSYVKYDKDDVVSCSGTVIDADVEFSSGNYIEHTAYIESGCSGGPLVNEEGYVVGLNDSDLRPDNYYSLNIDSIKTILDNYSISYTSYDLDQVYAHYQKLYKKCISLSKSGDYTYQSVEVLNKAIDDIKININDNSTIKDYENAIKSLKTAKSQLIKNTSTQTIIIYILIGVLLILITWLIFLLVINYRRTRTSKTNDKDIQDININPLKEINMPLTYPKNNLIKVGFLKNVHYEYVIRIEKNEFVLGSQKDNVDFVIDNKAVSRKHAIIKRIDNKFFVFDNNSVNGTYVNDLIVEDEGKELKNGDILALANEEFVFEINK